MEKILLLGGAGFLGKGLQKELSDRSISFKSLDIEDIDLVRPQCIQQLSSILAEYDNVVLLASKLGVKLFETDAKNAADYNRMLQDNVFESVEIASAAYNKKFAFTYYSTSEVFGSLSSKDDFIQEDTEYKIDCTKERHLYALVKLEAEKRLEKMLSDNVLSCLKVIRPFNVYGMNQKRGVLYDMIVSAITENKIYYSADTTRTMTDIDFASKMSVDAILSNCNLKVNVADTRCSLTIKSLASIVNSVLDANCQLVEQPKDGSIQYRNVSEVDADIHLSKNVMQDHIIKLTAQIVFDLISN